MSEEGRGVSRRGLLGVLGRGLRDLKEARPDDDAPPRPRAPRPRLRRKAADVVPGRADEHGRVVVDLRSRPLAPGESVRVDVEGAGDDAPIVLVRVAADHAAACGGACPDDRSDLLFSPDGDCLWCPGCGSRWSLDGRVARGPAVSGVASLPVVEAEGLLRILPV